MSLVHDRGGAEARDSMENGRTRKPLCSKELEQCRVERLPFPTVRFADKDPHQDLFAFDPSHGLTLRVMTRPALTPRQEKLRQMTVVTECCPGPSGVFIRHVHVLADFDLVERTGVLRLEGHKLKGYSPPPAALGGQRRGEHGFQASDERAAVHPLTPPGWRDRRPDERREQDRTMSGLIEIRTAATS